MRLPMLATMPKLVQWFRQWRQRRKQKRIERKLNKELSHPGDEMRPATPPSNRYIDLDSDRDAGTQ
jgi:hypothetical protein